MKEEALPSPEDLHDLWSVCGLDIELVEELVKLRLVVRGGKVLVSGKAHDETLFDRVLFCLFRLWRMRKFSDSRWASVGASCRDSIRCRLGGMPGLVHHILADASESNFHLQGFLKAGAAELEFITVAGLGSHPTDAALLELSEDCRVPKRLGHLTGAVLDEVFALAGVRGPVWALLGTVCGWSGNHLRSVVLATAHCSVAGMHERIFAEALKDPWRLTVGDVQANLRELVSEPEPSEPTAAKVWHLARSSLTALREAVAMLGDLSWGAKVAEEQHASAAVVTRHRPEMAQDAMCTRAFIHTCRRLLPEGCDVAKNIQRLQLRISRLGKNSLCESGVARCMQRACARFAQQRASQCQATML